MKQFKVYVSGKLDFFSNVHECKQFYANVGQACRALGMAPYVQHLAQVKNANPTKKFTDNLDQLRKSDILIAYMDEPCATVGMELGIAFENNIDIVLVYEEHVHKVPPTILGCTKVITHIRINNVDDAVLKIKAFLAGYKSMKEKQAQAVYS